MPCALNYKQIDVAMIQVVWRRKLCIQNWEIVWQRRSVAVKLQFMYVDRILDDDFSSTNVDDRIRPWFLNQG